MLFKSIKARLAVFAALVTLSFGTAHAVPYAWTDVYDPADIYLNAPNSTSFAHDITTGANGFRPGIDTVSSATLTLWLYDDSKFGDLPFLGDGEEYVRFNFDSNGWSYPQEVGGSSLLGGLFLDSFTFSLASLLNDGILNVVVQAFSGDFYFDKSSLIVFGDRSTSTSVPEPGTLALLGVGLLGVGLARRRSRRLS